MLQLRTKPAQSRASETQGQTENVSPQSRAAPVQSFGRKALAFLGLSYRRAFALTHLQPVVVRRFELRPNGSGRRRAGIRPSRGSGESCAGPCWRRERNRDPTFSTTKTPAKRVNGPG